MTDFTSNHDAGKLARACSEFIRSHKVCPTCKKPSLMFHLFDGKIVRLVCQECPTIVPYKAENPRAD